MKILHVFKTYLPDSFTGVERVIWEIAESTRPLGFESEVLSLSPNPRPAEVPVANHISVRCRQNLYVASTGLSLSLLSEFRRRAASADIIHYHFPWPMMDVAHLMTRPRVPSILTYHSDVVRQTVLLNVYRPLMHLFLRSVDSVVATSPNYARSSDVLQRYSRKVSVIPIGLGEAPPPTTQTTATLREKVGEGFFLFVGALRYYKGLPILLEAARDTGLRVVIAGKGEGEVQIRNAHLSNVTYLGEVNDDEKNALLSLCGAFVFPSNARSEAFGVALLEAARAGKPMISCELGTGTSFVNSHGETGVVVPPNDVAALSAAMRFLTENDLSRTLGERARDRYERIFTARAMGRSYADLYHSTLNETKHRLASVRMRVGLGDRS